MNRSGLDILRQPVYAVFKPSEIVRTPPTYDSGSVSRKIRLGVTLLAFFLGNILIYTLPLSLAGIGTVDPEATPPPAFETVLSGVANPGDAWVFLLRVTQNSTFLLAAAVITFLAFHAGVILSRSSKGIVRSLRVITYSSALYLATIFTLVWLTSTNPNIGVADELLLSLQSDFIYYFIDLLDSPLELPSGRIDRPPLSGLTPIGVSILSSLVISLCYYSYVLYLGARKTHGTSRIESVLVVLFVAGSPALYVIGSILVFEFAISVPELLFA